MFDFFKKYHKWLSIIFAFFIIIFSISGIILNHRQGLSSLSISRNALPSEYKLFNWNNAAVKASIKISDNRFLLYGNIGIWETDSNFIKYTDFNNGLPLGIDNRKICTLFKSSNNELFAGTFFGLYKLDNKSSKWQSIAIPTHEQRVVDIIEKDNKLLFMTRSHLVISNSDLSNMEIKTLPSPENYDNKISLFKTLWTIHSGEIFGTIGKLFVDLMGLVFIFLTVTGVILFINKRRLKPRVKAKKSIVRIASINMWNLKWHNKIGWVFTFFLIITTSTGIFLRPPLLIPIADAKVGKIPGTELASTNAWFDKLRRIIYDEDDKRFIVATLDGIYYSDDNFNSELKAYKHQPPASVMGVNVFHKIAPHTFMIGSFEGLFTWDTEDGFIMDYIKKIPYVKPEIKGPPIGDYLVTGYSNDFYKGEVAFLYNKGALNISNSYEFPEPTGNIISSFRMSLWNLALELHTGRFYSFIIGIFYIFVVPLSGFAILFILISGFYVWWNMYRGM